MQDTDHAALWYDRSLGLCWLLEHPELGLFALIKRRTFYLPYFDISDPEATQWYKIVNLREHYLLHTTVHIKKNRLFYMNQSYTSHLNLWHRCAVQPWSQQWGEQLPSPHIAHCPHHPLPSHYGRKYLPFFFIDIWRPALHIVYLDQVWFRFDLFIH